MSVLTIHMSALTNEIKPANKRPQHVNTNSLRAAIGAEFIQHYYRIENVLSAIVITALSKCTTT